MVEQATVSGLEGGGEGERVVLMECCKSGVTHGRLDGLTTPVGIIGNVRAKDVELSEREEGWTWKTREKYAQQGSDWRSWKS